MSDERDEIRARINIVDLVGRRVPLKRTGKNWTGLCPFHDDKKPSFFVSADSGRYKCWSCGESGDAFTWVMKTQNLTFVEALEVLAREAGVTLRQRDPSEIGQRTLHLNAMDDALSFFRSTLLTTEEARQYCDERGLSSDVLSTWEIGFAPSEGTALTVHLRKKGHGLKLCKELFLVDTDASGGFYDKFRGRLMFPIRDERGDLVAFGGRIVGAGEPKYINSSDTPLYRKSRVLYGLNRARDSVAKTRRTVLTEGYLDVIACHSAGVTNAIASLGTSLSEDHARLLKRWCDAVTILYDADAAGEKAAGRAVHILEAEGIKVRVALMPAGEDPDTLLRTAGPGAVQMAADGGMTPLDFRLRAIENRLTPAEPEFWTEIVEALGDAGTDLERESHLTRLAALYPGMRDVVSARRALRSEIVRVKRALRAAKRSGEAPKAVIVTPMSELENAERVVLRELLGEDRREIAWAALVEESLAISASCSDVVSGLMSTFGLRPPEGPANLWLGQLDDTTAGVIADCGLKPTEFKSKGIPAGQAELVELQGAIDTLRHIHARNSVRKVIADDRDDQKLREIQERLKNLKAT